MLPKGVENVLSKVTGMSVFVENLEVADLNLESYGERRSHTLYAQYTKAVPRLREMNASATAPVSADASVPGPNNAWAKTVTPPSLW